MIAPQFRPLVGGYERAAERLSGALVARGLDVEVVTERRDRRWPAAETVDGVRVRRLWCIPVKGLHRLTALATLGTYLLVVGRRYDVWHVHQHGDSAALARVIGWALRRPVVLKMTSTGSLGIEAVLAKHRLPALMRATHRRFDAVVALTRETAAEANRFGIPSPRIRVLANGLDVHAFRPASPGERLEARRQLGLGTAPCVTFVGRLVTDKNLPALLAGWERAMDQLPPDWRLLIVGDGPLRGALDEASAPLQAAGRVVMAGERHDVEVWLKASDVYVSTSDREGLSNTMLEAMACGLPIVATRVSGVTELIEETQAGITVEVGDVEGIARALVEMSRSATSREAFGRRAREVVTTRCSLETVGAAHEALYEQLAAGERQP
jgi:glycosyltransferase involved in cell wall biosynthesis